MTGFSYNGTDEDIALVRYNANGSLDITFDNDGIVTTSIGSGKDIGNSVSIQNDGKIIIVGFSEIGSTKDFAILRYNTDGSLDSNFDIDGIVTPLIPNTNEFGQSSAIQPDGKIVVGGWASFGSTADFCLIRLNQNGSTDSTFDVDGLVYTDIGTNTVDVCTSLALQNDGKIVVAGQSATSGIYEIALARYNSNGSLDNTFDVDGKISIALGSSFDKASSIALQADGKIIIGGTSYTGSFGDFVLLRYNSTGTIDNTFDTDGIVKTPIGSYNEEVNSIAIQNDGKIVAVGFSQIPGNDFAIARYNNAITPIASYSISSDSICLNNCLNFTDQSTNYPTSWAWTFQSGNPATSTSKNPTNICFANSGSFTATLIATNSAGADTSTQTVTILDCTGIEQVNNYSSINIFPNPFCKQTTLSTNQNLHNATLNIYSGEGQHIRQINNLSGQTYILQQDNLPNGFYFIQITQDNKLLLRSKLIILD